MMRSDPPLRMAFLPTGRRKFLELSLDWLRTQKVEPVVWFGDNQLDAEVRQLFPACEIIPQSLAVNPSSNDFLSGYPLLPAEELEQFFESSQYRSHSYLVAAEYDRFPRMATLRAIDREAIVRRLGQHVLGIFRSRQPDFFFAAETPHNALGLMALAVCSYLKIPTLFFQPTSSVGPNMLPRSSLRDIFTTEPLQLRIRQLNETHLELYQYRVDMLSRLLEGYLGEQPPPRFIQQQNRPSPRRARVERLRPSFRMQFLNNISVSPRFRALVQILRGRNLESLSMEILFDQFREHFLSNSARLRTSLDYQGTQQLALFGLHYQPERTSIPEGPLDSSQLDSILKARRMLPSDIHLVVKEHPSQVAPGRSGFLGRSHHFYEFLSNIPGITLVGPELSVFELLDKVSLTFTLTGTIGIQSILRSTPVIYFGNPWWQETPGSYRFEDSLSIHEVLTNTVPSKSELMAFLRKRVMEESVPGFSSPSQEKSWSVTDPISAGSVARREADFLREVLAEFLREARNPR